MRTHPLMAALALVAFASCTTPDATPAHAAVAPWEPVDAQFAGCHGACGAHAAGAEAGVVVQPGASIGQRAYCPVSGAVFEIEPTHAHAEVDGQTLWFCCAGCAEYFEAHRDQVLRARRGGSS